MSKRKKGDKLAVWMKDASQSAEVMRVGMLVKNKLGVKGRVEFRVHKSTDWRKGENMSV